MKKCFRTGCIKKNQLSDAENQLILKDMTLYNSMKWSSFLWQVQERKFFLENGTEQSHHLYLKQLFGCNDYFAASAKNEAKGIIRSREELRNLYLLDVKEDIKELKKELKKKRNYLKKLLTIKESFIAHQKNSEKMLKGTANIKYEKDGSVTLRCFQKKRHFETLYLFEHQWLDPRIRNLKNWIARMEHKQEQLEIKQKQLRDGKKLKVHFGGKKLCKKRNLPERHRALEKRRNQRMMIAGRKDGKNGNFVFHYDLVTNELSYRSMTDWNGKKIYFQGVIFPYGQELIEEYLRERKGAVAWEIIDRGNAWQICCVISVEAENMNNYYGDGTIGVDINYDRIAVVEIDKNGNLLDHKVFPFHMEGKHSGQTKQILSEILEQIFDYAKQKNKPITAEDINYIQRKKFYDKHRKKHQHITMFANACIRKFLISKSLKYHLAVRFVNPVYTSKAGKMKYMRRFGLSIHESAALCIARRGLGYKETLPSYLKLYLNDAKQRASINSQWGSLTKLIKKVTTQDIYHYRNPILRCN